MNTTSANASRKSHPAGFYKLLAGAAMISFSGVFVKLAHVGPTASAFYRMLFGAVLLWAIVLARGNRFRVGKKPLGWMAACGFFFALDLILWHRSVLYVGPGLSTILANFQVFFLAAFGMLILKEKLSLKYWISIPLAFSGLFLIIGGDWGVLNAQYKTGLMLGLLTALAYSSYLLTFRQFQTRYGEISPFTTIAIISSIAALFLGLEMVVEGESFGIPDLASWISLTGYGLFGQVFGWVLISRGIAEVKASRAGLILLLQPGLAFVWDVLFFGRPAGPMEISGCVLAIAGIYLGSSVEKRG